MRQAYSIILIFLLLGLLPLQARELPKGVAWLWEFEQRITVPPVVDGEIALVVTGSTAQGLLLANGERVWTLELPSSCLSDSPPLVVSGAAILQTSAGRILSVDIATGQERWNAPAFESCARLCAGRLIVIEAGTLQALDPATGQVRWRLGLSKVGRMSVNGSRVLYSSDKELGVCDLATGKVLWQEPAKELDKLNLGPQVALSLYGDLVARDPATGRRLWKLPEVDQYYLIGDRVLASTYYTARCVSARSGQKLWEVFERIQRAVAVGPDLLATSSGWDLTMRDIRNGKPLRELDAFYPPLSSGGVTVAAGQDGKVYRMDSRTAKFLPGISGVWGASDTAIASPVGAVAGKLTLLPAGTALAALGDGPGTLHLAGKTELQLFVDGPQVPGKISITLDSKFLRQVALSAYRFPAESISSPLSEVVVGPAVATTTWSSPAGAASLRQSTAMTLKEPGNYIIEARAGEKVERRALTLTPIGLMLKLAPGQILLQALDVVRHVPLPGVSMELAQLGTSTSPGISGTTGPDGLVRLESDLALDQPMQIRVRRAAESFVFTVTPEKFAGLDKIFLQTDRPLYRPGHEVFFKGLAASGAGADRKPLGGRQITVEVRDSGDNALLAETLTSDAFGSFSGSLRLPDEPPLGRYRVSAWLDSDQPFHLPFEVQEYRKPPFEVEMTARTPLVRAGAPIVFDLRATYYFGGPVPNAPVKVTVRRAALSGKPSPGYPGYQSYADYLSEEEIKLGADGRAEVQIPTEKGEPDSEYLVDVEVTGPSGQVVEGSASALSSTTLFGVYLTQGSWLALPGQPVSVGIELLDRLAQPHAGVVDLQVQRYDSLGWTVVSKHPVQVGASGKASFSWTPPKKDSAFRIVAFSPGASPKADPLDEVTYWVEAGGVSTTIERKLRAEKDQYRAGETARLLLQSPETVPALLTVEGDEIFLSRAFTIKKGSQMLSFPIEASFAPGVTATVSMERWGRQASDSVHLDIPDTAHQLSLRVRAEKPEYRPGETAVLELTVTDVEGNPVDADASLAVVDEALFALRPDQVPGIHGTFFGPRPNRVQTFRVEPARNQVAGFQTVPAPTRVRKDFKDTAFWQPNVLIQGGKARVMVPLPDNLTRWRATSRASTADMKVGQGTTTVVSNLPLMAQAILPRFLVEGDAVDMLALVSNRTKSPQDVEVTLAATPGELEKTTASLAGVPADGQGRVESRLRVEENVLGKQPLPSRLEVQVQAHSGGATPESDAEEISVPILPFGTPYAVGKSGILKAGAERKIALKPPRGLLKPKLQVRVAGSPQAALEGALDYLAEFPYGCVEQTMSRFLPTVVAAQAMGDLGLFSDERKQKLAPMVEESLSKLYGYQHSDGGWGWWVEDETHPFMTGYVISGLSMAQRAGYSVSEPVLKRGIGSANYQLTHLDVKDVDNHGVKDLDTRVYLAWALSIAGQPPLEILGELSASKDLSTYSTALLALAWQAAGQGEKALPLVAELERRARPTGIGNSWPAQALTAYGWTDDDVEATALSMRALLAAKPDSSVAADALPWLFSQREGARWKSTRDTAQAVLALLDYAGHHKTSEAARQGSLAVSWNGETLQTVALNDKESVVSVPVEKLQGSGELGFSSSGSAAIYSYSYTGFVKEKEQVDLPAQYDGLRLVRTYVVEQPGQLLKQNRVTPPEILSVPSGQELEVEIEFNLPNKMQYLLLEDPRPAGFEVIGESTDGDVRPDRREDHDAFTAFFFTSLAAGKHYITYRMRAETPGEYRSLPARLELMYHPSIFGASPSQRVKIRRPGEAKL